MNPRSTPSRLARIAEENLAMAWRLARRCGVADEYLDDVVQEVFLVVNRRLETVQPERERAFVAGVTVRVCANWRRSQRRRPEEPLSDSEARCVGGESPEAAAARKEGLRLLRCALDRMTRGQQEVFILTELEQLTAREVGEELQLHEQAVVSRLRRARQIFYRFCEEWQAQGSSTLLTTGAICDV